ncbi:hypothetical protein MKW92_012465 [Papaver armeniacum]|nr:hypothetical protein MKW92_012465 [Papaver armeniacum]
MEDKGNLSKSERLTFALPVDSDNKATQFKILSLAKPHMRAFHLSWISFFACFVSTFAAPPLLPVIRDNLNLTATDIGNAGIASASGAVFARLVMGTACDLWGPRLASSALILLTSPAVYFTATINSPISFLLVRFSLVSHSPPSSRPSRRDRKWCCSRLGNLGGGATQLVMPLVYELIRKMGSTNFTAWRIAFSSLHSKDNMSEIFYHGIKNYRVELTVDNIIAEYFFDRFNLKLHTAGLIAASFGLANFVSRPGGGMFSDFMAKRYGMRGRIWSLWLVQTTGGVLFIFFKGAQYSKETGNPNGYYDHMLYTLALIYFPQWGGMFFGPTAENATKEEYYASEWNSREKEEGKHLGSLKFAETSKSERGRKIASQLRPTNGTSPTTV